MMKYSGQTLWKMQNGRNNLQRTTCIGWILSGLTCEKYVRLVFNRVFVSIRDSLGLVLVNSGLCMFRHLLQLLSDYYSRCGPPF